MQHYDVIVVGGGTAGVIAAVQAGRAGATTLLVERTGMLGGTVTVGGINAPAHFFAWGRQVIGGIGWELVRRAYEETGHPVPTPEFTTDTPTPRHLTVDILIYAALCDQAVLDAGCTLLFHAMPAAVTRRDDGWELSLCTKTGLQPVTARVLIDATGDANLVTLAGYDVIRPETVQPATLAMRCSGYDPDALDYDALAAAAERAIAAGELVTTDISWRNTGPRGFLFGRGRNANHLRAPRAETSEGRSAAEVEARRAALRAYRFFRRQPGLAHFQIDAVCPEVGIRETVTIKGKHTITIEEYEAGVVYDDAVCYAFYPVDEHLNDGLGINYRPLKHPVLPTIPRGALLPADSQHLIVAGRCLASDREALSALRVEAPCMAM
ncbi:MAG TPA: FAD-dependent oxidoreductase, partial [Armatimonadota bacterium]|nr:FAD-dependent oxidoreductase [Armatimonadota bacterium]